MSFRKKKATSEEKRQYDAFLDATRELVIRIGLPLLAMETHSKFQYFLMHGYFYDDQMDFSLNKLGPDQLEALLLLIDKYFEAGFQSPGLGIFGTKEHERFAQKYPKQFHSRLEQDFNSD